VLGEAEIDGDEPMPGTQDSARDGGDSALQAELDAIVNGTHAGLAAELSKHTAVRDAKVALAARRRDEQLRNSRAIADCEDKQSDDTCREDCEDLRDRMCNVVYAKYGKPNPQMPAPVDLTPTCRERKRAPLYQAPWLAAVQRRRLLPAVQIRYALSDVEVEEDLDALLQEAEKTKQAREAEARGEDAEPDEPLDVHHEKQQGALVYGELVFERWAAVQICDKALPSGQAGDWCITAIGPLEVTLRNTEGARTKVSLAALRSRRLAFTPLGVEP